jgi:hypothetical protein
MNEIVFINPRETADPREDRAVFRRTFDGRAGIDFSALNDAEAFLTARGFSFGPGCIGKPQGVMYGSNWQIAKWRNLSPTEQSQLHGTITGDRCKGPVRVAIFWNAPAFAIAAVAEPHLADRIVSTWATQR